MTKTLTRLAVLAVIGSTMAAQALTLTWNDRIGSVRDGSPAGDAAELVYINTLLNSSLLTSLNTDFTFSQGAPVGEVKTYNKHQAITGPVFTAFGVQTQNETAGTGVGFILAKYGDVGEVLFQVNGAFTLPGNSESFELPWYKATGKNGQNKVGTGLSHYTLFATSTREVPDGGATVALLGVGILGLGAMRRKLS
jgi:hypothetical protein